MAKYTLTVESEDQGEMLDFAMNPDLRSKIGDFKIYLWEKSKYLYEQENMNVEVYNEVMKIKEEFDSYFPGIG